MTFLQRLIGGHFEPKVLFWGFYFGFILGLSGLNRIFVQLYLTSDSAATSVVHRIVVGIAVLYSVVILRALYLRMYRDRSPSGWTWAGCGVILITIFDYGFAFLQLNNTNIAMTNIQIKAEFMLLQASLPENLGDGVKLVRAEFNEGKILYVYQIQAIGEDVKPEDLLYDKDRKVLCKDLRGYFKGPVEVAEFRYRFYDTSVSTNITRADCAAYWAN